jgi:hypothetical protein
MITYNTPYSGIPISVLLNDKIVGHIKQVEGGYQYFPKGKKTGGPIFKAIREVKSSLENE